MTKNDPDLTRAKRTLIAAIRNSNILLDGESIKKKGTKVTQVVPCPGDETKWLYDAVLAGEKRTSYFIIHMNNYGTAEAVMTNTDPRK